MVGENRLPNLSSDLCIDHGAPPPPQNKMLKKFKELNEFESYLGGIINRSCLLGHLSAKNCMNSFLIMIFLPEHTHVMLGNMLVGNRNLNAVKIMLL